MHRLAIYDLDRTITRIPTWTPFLIHTARARTPWRLALMPLGMVLAAGYLLRLMSRGRLKERMHRLMLGTRLAPATIDDIARDFAGWMVPGRIHPRAVQRIEADRRAGYRIVIATASYRFYVEALARRLGIVDVIGTEAVVDASGAILPKILGANCYGEAKLAMVEAWLAGEGIARDAAHIRFYSDHVSDAPTLAWADEAYAVNAHPPLAALATARGWPQLDWQAR